MKRELAYAVPAGIALAVLIWILIGLASLLGGVSAGLTVAR